MQKMKETLHIKNFGPIKEVKLELGKVNVFIGDNGTGKTSIGKILCICRYFSYINSINEGGMQSAFKEWGLEELMKINTEIYYDNFDYELSIKGEEVPYEEKDQIGEVFTNYYWDLIVDLNSKSERFVKLQEELYKERYSNENSSDELTAIDRIILNKPNEPSNYFYQQIVNKVMVNPFFLTTDRVLQSLFVLGKSSLQNINDSLFSQFSKLDSIQRKFNKEIEIEPFGITYKNDNGVGKFKIKSSNSFYNLENAPSGFKTAIPIILASKYYTEILKKNKFLIIDEPENSLFPIGQKKLVDFLVNRTINYIHPVTKNKFNNQLLLTTHSPYILTSLNNLMYAYTVGQINKKEVSSIIEEKYWLNPEDVSAYMLVYDKEKGGIVEKNIVDEETKLIKSEMIDSVSRDLNEEFDKLLNIELENE